MCLKIMVSFFLHFLPQFFGSRSIKYIFKLFVFLLLFLLDLNYASKSFASQHPVFHLHALNAGERLRRKKHNISVFIQRETHVSVGICKGKTQF